MNSLRSIGNRVWTVTNGPVTVISNAFLDGAYTNCLAMATGAVQCLMPTIPGHRYQLTYALRGPCASGWWNGTVDPLSRRAEDLISGNNGEFFNGATNTVAAFLGDTAQVFVGLGGFYFSGQTEPPPDQDPDLWPEDIDDPSAQLQLADPPQLQFTNAFTIEGWIKPTLTTNDDTVCGVQQIFFRGYPEPFDCSGTGTRTGSRFSRTFGWKSVSPGYSFPSGRCSHGHELRRCPGHQQPHCDWRRHQRWLVSHRGGLRQAVHQPGSHQRNQRLHFQHQCDAGFHLNGTCIATNYTQVSPYQNLDPALSPGAAIGGRCRFDWTESFSGYMDEITVYARALTDPEIFAIAQAGTAGQADLTVPAAQSLAKLSVDIDGINQATSYGDNSTWTTYTMEFTAIETNAVVTLQSLLPGTLLQGITLTELPSELYYLPEQSLSTLFGEDAFGVWTLEIWDNRTGPGTATNLAQLIEWQLNFGLGPSNPPPVITLEHGIFYTKSLPMNTTSIQVISWCRCRNGPPMRQTSSSLPIAAIPRLLSP